MRTASFLKYSLTFLLSSKVIRSKSWPIKIVKQKTCTEKSFHKIKLIILFPTTWMVIIISYRDFLFGAAARELVGFVGKFKEFFCVGFRERRRTPRSTIKTRKSSSKVILVIFNNSICRLASPERIRWRRKRRIMVHQLIVDLALLPTFTFTSDNSTSTESLCKSYYSHRKEITKLRVELLHFLHSSPSLQLSSK